MQHKPPKDVTDFFDAGGTADELNRAAMTAKPLTAADVADATSTSDAAKSGPVLVRMADVEPREVKWLWPGRIPLGRITLLVGRPGEGKSFLTTDLAARVSTGSPLPDGTACDRGSVLIISGEDDPHDTIRPRLDAHHADVERVHLLSMVRRIGEDGKPQDIMFTLADVPALEDALRQLTDCRLIIVDPIGSFLGGGVDSHRDNETRAVLAPVAALAEKYGPAVLIVAHRRKAGGDHADDLALGSRAFTGIARACWHLSRDPDNKRRRLLLPGKNNLAAEGDGLAFDIAGDPPSIRWESAAVTMSADDALAAENAAEDAKPGPEPEARDEAAEWLRDELADLAEHPVAALRENATAAGLAWRTIQRAKAVIGALSHRASFGGGYVWRLPKPAAPNDAATVRATFTENETTWHPGTQGENQGKTPDSACQVPLRAKLIPLGTHGPDNGKSAATDGEQLFKDYCDIGLPDVQHERRRR